MTSRERESAACSYHTLCSLFSGALSCLWHAHRHTENCCYSHSHMQEQRRCRCYVFVFAKIKQQFNNFFVAKRACSFSLIFVFSFFFRSILHTWQYSKAGACPLSVGWLNPLSYRQTDRLAHTHTRALASTHTSALAWLDGIQWVVVPETIASNGRLKSKWQNWTASRMSAGEWGNALRTTTTAQQLARETRFKGNFKQH